MEKTNRKIIEVDKNQVTKSRTDLINNGMKIIELVNRDGKLYYIYEPDYKLQYANATTLQDKIEIIAKFLGLVDI